jgi:hypothetical protein
MLVREELTFARKHDLIRYGSSGRYNHQESGKLASESLTSRAAVHINSRRPRCTTIFGLPSHMRSSSPDREVRFQRNDIRRSVNKTFA